MVLDRVNLPKDLKKLNIKEKKKLSKEIRDLIIDVVSKNGGHLASNLGVVELTVALHSVYDTPTDKLIWDVGHQCYVHKILTGRKNEFKNIRKFNCIAGFPKTNESVYDTFNTGHSSTSLSIGAGFARKRDIFKENYNVISIIGDGALTGGMALEALNDIGSSKLNMTIILNDNQMSISRNVGGISLLLSKLRSRKFYTKSNNSIKLIFSKIPIIGKLIISIVRKIKMIIKSIFIKNMYFEDLGFTYLGPVDGHNLEQLESILKHSKTINGPILIHVITKKGKGYKFAEKNPDIYHAVSTFDPKFGVNIKNINDTYSSTFGNKLIELAKKDKSIVAITAAMKDSTGLGDFSKLFPNRFFDVGIAEQHALGLAAGLASSGLKPVVPIYSSFLQRGYDQLIHDIAINNLNVTICADRAGLVGSDGETHHGLFDLTFLTIPNFIIMSPKDLDELSDMLEFSINLSAPTLIRYPKGKNKVKYNKHSKIRLGKCEILNKGNDVCLLALGSMNDKACNVYQKLINDNISCELINVRFLKPIDKDIIKSIKKCKLIVTLEDGMLNCGLRSEVLNLVSNNNIKKKILSFGYEEFITHGLVDELEKKYNNDSNSIYEEIIEQLSVDKKVL